MLKVRSKVVGVDNTKAKLYLYGETVQAKLRHTIADLGEELALRVKSLAPKRSGELASSIDASLKEKPWVSIRSRISTNTFYARFMERSMKTRFSVKSHWRETGRVRYEVKRHDRHISGKPLHPFMAPALESMRNRIRARIDEALGR